MVCRARPVATVAIVAAIAYATACAGDDDGGPSGPALPPRPAEQTCAIRGTPPGFVPDVVLRPIASLDEGATPPAALAALPGDPSRALLGTRGGALVVVSLADGALTLLADLSARVATLLALATEPEPDAEITTRHLFVAYVPTGAPTRVRVSRFDLDLDAAPSAVDVGTERTILDLDTELGAALAVASGAILFVATGDSDGDGSSESAQDFGDLRGKVLRLDVSTLDTLGHYTVPSDNPNDPSGAPSVVFARGLRAPAHCTFDQATGALLCVDRGVAYDEILRVEAGDNHGWPRVDGTSCVAGTGRCSAFDFDPALVVHRHDDVECGFVGGARVRDAASALDHTYFYGDACGGALRGFVIGGFRTYEQQVEAIAGGIAALGTSDDGTGLVAGSDGAIYAIAPRPDTGPFPERLSETGCFTDVGTLAPAPDVVPYGVRSPLWSDGSGKDRFLMVPAGARIRYTDDGPWEFPEGSVLFKAFAMELVTGDPSTRRLLEIRALVRRRHQWQGHTYRYDAATNDAVLLDDSVEEPLEVMRDGETLAITHLYPDRFGCAVCHGFRPPAPIALRTAQMDRVVRYGDVEASQLDALADAGFFESALPSSDARARLPRPSDPAESPTARARAYLDANCAHCHRPGGWVPPTLDMDLRYDVAFADTHLCNERSAYADGRVRLVPGDAESSLLFERASTRGLEQMPPIGTSIVDPDGTAILRAFIDGLSGCP